MPEKDPTTWTQGIWILATAMAIGGGIVNWYSRVRQGNVRVFNIIELFGEIFASGLVGLGTFMGLAGMEQSLGICAAGAGIAGHMGTRLLFAIERALESRITKLEKGDNGEPGAE